MGGSALVAESTVHTALPKVDTSSVEAPAAQALVARSGSEAPNDNPVGDDPDLLNFAVEGSWIAWWMSSLLQSCWPNSGKPNCPAFLVLGHEDVKGGLWALRRLAPLVLLPLAILHAF
jgi:hypothetical protein